MRRLALVLVVVGCGTRHQSELVPSVPVADAAPPAIDASAPPRPDARTMDGRWSFGLGHRGPGGGGGGVCEEHPVEATMTMSKPLVSSRKLDPKALRRAMRFGEDKLELCLDMCLPLAGTSVRVTFTVPPDGEVRSAQASGENADVERCVEDVIGSLNLPKPRGGAPVDLTYVLTFSPGKP